MARQAQVVVLSSKGQLVIPAPLRRKLVQGRMSFRHPLHVWGYVDDVPDSDPQKDVLTNYRDDYEDIYGEGTVNTFGGHAFDALSMIVMALEEMDEDLSTADAREFIRDFIENDIEDWPGTGGVFTMSPEDHLGMAPGSLALIKIVDGEWTWLQ